MIDGLDEFEGEPQELIDMVTSLARLPHVKLCIASRPWQEFADAFESTPSLLLERLTRDDISTYVNTHFIANRHFELLLRTESDHAKALLTEIVLKANGVFLWVHLVVQSLVQGLTKAARMSDLRASLDTLPPEMERLYSKLLETLDEDYLTHACQLFRLVLHRANPTLLHLWAIDTKHDDSAIRTEVGLIYDLADHLEVMHRRMVTRGKGLLEIEGVSRTTELRDRIAAGK